MVLKDMPADYEDTQSGPTVSERIRKASSSPPRRTVYLLRDEREEHSWLQSILNQHYSLGILTSADDIAARLGTVKPDLLVATAGYCNRKFLDQLGPLGLSGSVLFIAEPEGLDNYINAIAKDHVISVFANGNNQEKLLDHIHRILYPRTTARHEQYGLYVEIASSEVPLRKLPAIDVSNNGCAFELGAAELKRGLLPGSWLDHIRIIRRGNVVLEGTGAVVRHMGRLDPETSGVNASYKVGVEFTSPSERHLQLQRKLRDRVEISAALKAASRTSEDEVQVGFPEDFSACWNSSLTEISVEDGLLCLSGATYARIERGDVLRVAFDVGGTNHWFLSSVQDVSTESFGRLVIQLRLPRTITAVRRRVSSRFRPDESNPVLVSVPSPFNTGTIRTHAIDVTTSGVSFYIDKSTDLFPVGASVSGLELKFPNGLQATLNARVRALSPASAEGSVLRCGVEFEYVSAKQRSAMADEIVRCTQPKVRDASGTPFDDIWRFLETSGFLYPEKLKKLDQNAVRHTMRSLLSQPNEVFKTCLYWDQDEIQGHISALRSHENTWGIQHLAATGGLQCARLLNLAISEFIEQRPEIEWLRIYFRPNNRWPERIFGSFANRLVDPERSDIRTFDYYVRSTRSVGEEIGGFSIRPWERGDTSNIEAAFLRKGRVVDIHASDISESGLLFPELSRRYADIGLERRREVLVAERSGSFAGAAILELSSPGLNLSEITNSFTIVALDQHDRTAVRALANAAAHRYAELGRNYAFCLADAEDALGLQQAGYENAKQYRSWTLHRSLLRSFYGYAARKFG